MQLTKFNNHIAGPTIKKFESKSAESSTKYKTFLLIDDEPMVTDICEMMLKSLGHTVLKAYSGSEGLELYETNKNRIDQVLLSTGGLSVTHEEEAIGRGFNGFLQKPYSLDALTDKIAEILN